MFDIIHLDIPVFASASEFLIYNKCKDSVTFAGKYDAFNFDSCLIASGYY